MTPVQQARDQLRILQQVLDLTPPPEDLQPDIQQLQRLVNRRRQLLAGLTVPDLDADDDQELVVLVAEAGRMVAEIIRRDAEITALLREARDRVRRQLNRVGTNRGGLAPSEAGSWIA